MRKLLQVIALLLALGVLGEWIFRGRTGWTHNTETRFVTDPVTGIDGPVEEKKFTPGVDFLAGGLAVASVLGGASFLFQKQKAG